MKIQISIFLIAITKILGVELLVMQSTNTKFSTDIRVSESTWLTGLNIIGISLAYRSINWRSLKV